MPPLRTDSLLTRARALPALGDLLERAGTTFAPRLLLVGGAIRDLLLGATPLDLDIAVEGPLSAVQPLIGQAAASHETFGTATLCHEGARVDLASTRAESYPAPGALPVVAPADIVQDLRRRDFTVNAIALVLTGADAGTLLEFPGGLTDLQGGCLRVLHDRSFVEDPTRLLRLARYRARLAFAIAPATLALAQDAVATGALSTVSGARLGNELRLLAAEHDPVTALRALAGLGIDRAIHPDLGLRDAAAERAARDALELLPPDGRRDLTVLALAARQLSKPALAALLDDLAFTASDRDVIVQAATGASLLAAALGAASRPSEIDDAVGGVSLEAIAVAAAIASKETPANASTNATAWLTDLRHRHLQIIGDDLIAAGVPEGPAVGAGLKAATAAMLDGEASGAGEQLAVALAAARKRIG